MAGRPPRDPPRDIAGYTHDLKPVRRYLGGKKLQQLTKADGDELVEWMLTEGRSSPKRYRPDSLAARVVELIEGHPEGIAAATIAAAFPEDDVHTCLSGLLRAGRVTRLGRAVYTLNDLAEAEVPARGVKPVTVRSTLTTFAMVVQSFVDQGALPRNIIALVERPADAIIDETSGTSKSWTLAEVERFRDSVRHDRLYACWLLSCYGLRRSEVLGLRWSALDGDTLLIRRGRVTVGKESDEGMPKSRRSRAACQCTSSRPGTATIRRCRYRSTPTPSAMTCAPPAPHCSPRHRPTHGRLGHCWPTATHQQGTLAT